MSSVWVSTTRANAVEDRGCGNGIICYRTNAPGSKQKTGIRVRSGYQGRTSIDVAHQGRDNCSRAGLPGLRGTIKDRVRVISVNRNCNGALIEDETIITTVFS